MEFTTYSNSHNITGMASKFAKVFKLRSFGVIFSQTNTNTNTKERLQSSSAEVFYTEKVHPQPQEIRKCKMNFDIEEVFEAISAIKLAYVNLQDAHLPYDPLKIKSADKCIVLQLEKLSQMKRSFDKLIRIKQAETDSCHVAHVNLQLLDELENEVNARESWIIGLKKEIQDLSLSNAKMIEKFTSSKNKGSINVTSFEDIHRGASNAFRDFTKMLITLMRDSGWDLDCAANSIEKSIIYSKSCHKKYAFQAFVARRMLYLFSSQFNEKDDFDHRLRFEDPISALIEDPSSSFAEFCISKYLLVIHPKLEASFFGNLDHREMISKGKHPRTAFYQAFVKMARWIWLLREIADLMKPTPQIFGVQKGTKFSSAYMESVMNDIASLSELQVQLMVMPGFRIGNSVVKCKVYASVIKH